MHLERDDKGLFYFSTNDISYFINQIGKIRWSRYHTLCANYIHVSFLTKAMDNNCQQFL